MKVKARGKVRCVLQKTDECNYFINFLILSVQSEGAARLIKVACHLLLKILPIINISFAN